MTLEEWNAAPEPAAGEAILSCCGSARWAEEMLKRRPFESAECMHSYAESIWRNLSAVDWLEAFSKHPKIGARSDSRWSNEEQRGMAGAQSSIADSIQELNTRYENRFGYIFIVCAAGKSAEDMLGLLRQRISNERGQELLIAAAEQGKIMHLRLDKLLGCDRLPPA